MKQLIYFSFFIGINIILTFMPSIINAASDSVLNCINQYLQPMVSLTVKFSTDTIHCNSLPSKSAIPEINATIGTITQNVENMRSEMEVCEQKLKESDFLNCLTSISSQLYPTMFKTIYASQMLYDLNYSSMSATKKVQALCITRAEEKYILANINFIDAINTCVQSVVGIQTPQPIVVTTTTTAIPKTTKSINVTGSVSLTSSFKTSALTTVSRPTTGPSATSPSTSSASNFYSTVFSSTNSGSLTETSDTTTSSSLNSKTSRTPSSSKFSTTKNSTKPDRATSSTPNPTTFSSPTEKAETTLQINTTSLSSSPSFENSTTSSLATMSSNSSATTVNTETAGASSMSSTISDSTPSVSTTKTNTQSHSPSPFSPTMASKATYLTTVDPESSGADTTLTTIYLTTRHYVTNSASRLKIAWLPFA